MAAQKVYAPRLQRLHARILITGIRVVWIFRCGSLLQRTFALVEKILHRGLPGCWAGYVQPLADLVLVPDIVVVVEHVRVAMQCRYDLDLVLRDSETELQTIESIFDAVQGRPIGNLHHVEHLLDSGRLVHQLQEFGEFPFRGLPDERRFSSSTCPAKPAERCDSWHRAT